MPATITVAQARTSLPSTSTMQVSQVWIGPKYGVVADLRQWNAGTIDRVDQTISGFGVEFNVINEDAFHESKFNWLRHNREPACASCTDPSFRHNLSDVYRTSRHIWRRLETASPVNSRRDSLTERGTQSILDRNFFKRDAHARKVSHQLLVVDPICDGWSCSDNHRLAGWNRKG